MPWYTGFLRSRIPADGNCFFTAALAAQKGVHPSKVLMQDVMELRKNVATAIHHPTMADTIETYFSIAQSLGEDPPPEEIAHIPHADKATDRADWLDQLEANMMNPAVYWGDEFAIKVLQTKWNTRIIVVASVGKVVTLSPGPDHGADFSPDTWVCLYLKDVHYEPLWWHTIGPPQPFSHLPNRLKRLAKRDLALGEMHAYQRLYVDM